MSRNHWYPSDSPRLHNQNLHRFHGFSDLAKNQGTMTSSLVQIAHQRQHLTRELSAIRQASLSATRNHDFRRVAHLTLEAARLNRSIAETDVQAETAR